MKSVVVVSPFVAAIRFLEARYGREVPTGEGRTFDLAAFQEDAVQRAKEISRRWGGVLVADSVGLGKTYVALALIEDELNRGGRVLVVTPAALRSQWQTPLRRIARERGGISARWVSHTLLSRGGVSPQAAEAFDLVVVDEAHGFRNPATRRYRELARLCRGARVVLLTATPVNNTPLDLYAQIRLFAGDGGFHSLGVTDMRAAFRAAALRPDAALPAPVLALLRAVMIRRTRPLVSDMLDRGVGQHALRFPQRAPPAAVRYDLAAAYPGVYEEAADLLESLTFAPFRTGSYTRRVPNEATSARVTASGAAELLRILLLKRLESSVSALTASIAAQIRFLESFLDHLRTGRLLTPADHRSFRGPAETDAVQLFLGDVVLAEVPSRLDVRALELDACADLERLRAFRRRLGASAGRDPKVNRLFELLDGPLARERVLLFTEFRETATYLWTALRDRGGVGLIHGGGAYLGRSACGRREVIERFAPAANSAPPPPAREALRLLIATDVLAEGMNLQDARHVISYDLPWNPVRLVQRIGRIDRLGSPHDVIFTHAFLPDHGLERLLRLLERVRAKLHTIQAGVGIEPNLVENVTAETSSDSRVFLGRLSRGDATLLDEIERRDSAPFEIEERLRIAWLRYGEAHVLEMSADAVPFAVMSLSHASDQRACVLLSIRNGEWVQFVRFSPHDSAIEVDPPCAFALLLDVLNSRHSECPATDSDRELVDCALAHVRRVLCERTRFLRPNHSSRGPSATLSRHLLATLAREPGGPDSELCARVESMLSRIGTGGPAGLEYDLAELIARDRTRDRMSAVGLCSAIESLLDPRAYESRQPPPQSGDIELLAAIAFR